MSEAKVGLGRFLFYDKRLSINGSQSCSSCHRQELAFTDGRAVAVGATGESHSRGAMSLVNVAYSQVLTWSDPTVVSLEKQVLIPLFSEHPIELGMRGREQSIVARLRMDEPYRALFPKAFPADKNPFTIANVARSIAAFERTIISASSPYDRYFLGHDPNAISESAVRGERVFYNETVGNCYRSGSSSFSQHGPLQSARALLVSTYRAWPL
jgi:cytochrome c peroxidase